MKVNDYNNRTTFWKRFRLYNSYAIWRLVTLSGMNMWNRFLTEPSAFIEKINENRNRIHSTSQIVYQNLSHCFWMACHTPTFFLSIGMWEVIIIFWIVGFVPPPTIYTLMRCKSKQQSTACFNDFNTESALRDYISN